MGVRGLKSFINKLPDCSKKVKIIDEIKKYRLANGCDPVIIIDLWTMTYNLKQTTKDVIVGSRLNKIEKRFEKFLSKLKAAGTNLIFVFKKTRVSSKGFIKEEEECYANAQFLVKKLGSGASLADVERQFLEKERREYHFEFPFNQAVMLVMSQVAQKFGALHGMDTIQYQAATFNVHLANKYKAMAILGLNTYYVFFDGPWVFWSDAELNVDAMTVLQYNKEKVLSAMRLTTQKAPLFAALAGGLRSSEENSARLERHFEARKRGQMIQRVVQFVNDQRLTFPVSEPDLIGVISKIFGSCSPDLLEDFQKTMQLMDPVENLKVHHEVDSSIMELIKDDFANYAEEILENSPIFISPVYLDLSKTSPSFHDLVSVFIQKAAGLLLKHQSDQKPRKLLVKPSEFARFTEIEIAPIIPEFDVVPLKILVTGRMSDDEKWQILLWLSGLSVSVADLKTIPDDFLMDVIICLHLLKARAVSMLEAECLVRSIVVAHKGAPFSIYPQNVNARAFNVGTLYTKIFCVLRSSISAVGLSTLQNKLMFDAAQFQQIYTESEADTSAFDAVDLIAALNKLVSIAKEGAGPATANVVPSSNGAQPVASDLKAERKAVTNDSASTEATGNVDEIIDNLQAISLK